MQKNLFLLLKKLENTESAQLWWGVSPSKLVKLLTTQISWGRSSKMSNIDSAVESLQKLRGAIHGLISYSLLSTLRYKAS